MLVTDTVLLGQPRKTRHGYMVVDAAIARTGIQLYSGAEMGKPSMDTVRVYRPEAEVFSDKAMGSFCHQPVTDDHPPELVTAANWKRHSVGMTGDAAVRDGDHIRVPFTLMDQAAIDTVQAGKRELSCGYLCEIDWTPGTTAAGEAYDAIQTNIRGNHLAIVDRGRAGSTCRIGDAWAPVSTTAPIGGGMTTRSIIVDGVSIQFTDQAAQAFDKVQAALKDVQTKLDGKEGQIAALTAQHGRALEAKDGEKAALVATHATALQAKDGEIAALTAKVPDAAALDALVATRTATLDAARTIMGATYDATGKSDVQVRRDAVTKQLGDAAVQGQGDEYVRAAFDVLTATAGRRDPMADAIRGNVPVVPGQPHPLKDASPTYEDRMANRWKGAA